MQVSDYGINKIIVNKLLAVVDAGLVSGLGIPKPGKMCVEAAVCFAFGERHNDVPNCVDPALSDFKIHINDSTRMWTSTKGRAKGLRRLAIAQLGTRNNFNVNVFNIYLREEVCKSYIPAMLKTFT